MGKEKMLQKIIPKITMEITIFRKKSPEFFNENDSCAFQFRWVQEQPKACLHSFINDSLSMI